MPTTLPHQGYSFLRGGGEMGALIRSHDWSKTPVGTPDNWPQSLRTILSLLLTSRFPMFLFWGPEYICFYNDAYRPSLGNNGKHPGILGMPGKEAWPEIWDFIGPMIDSVRAGEGATWYEDQLLPIYRNGQMEDVYWTFSYSPVSDESGEAAGVFVTCTETTKAVAGIAELRESQQRFQNLLRDATVGLIVLTGEDMRVEMVNEAYCKLIGHSVADTLHRPLFEVIPDAKATFLPILQEVLATGTPFSMNGATYQVHGADGATIEGFINFVYQPYREADGTISGVMAMVHDVTEQALAQQKIRESEARFRNLLQEAPVAATLFRGPELVLEIANELTLKYWNKGPEIIGRPLVEGVPELAEQSTVAMLQDFFRRGGVQQFSEAPVSFLEDSVLKEGFYNHTLKTLHDEDGNVESILAVGIDVTEQVLARRKLEESEATLELLSNSVPAMIFYIDAGQRYRSYNETFMQWFGVDKHTAIGKTVREFLGKAAYERALPHLTEAYAGKREQYDIPAPTRLDPDRWLSIVYTPHMTADGEVVGIIVHATDITQSKQTEIALRESEVRFRSLVEEAPVATCLFTGREMKIEVANELMIGFWGKGTSVIGKPLADAVPELKGQPFPDLLDEVFTTGKTYEAIGAQTMLEIDGVIGTYYFDFTYKPLFDAAGKVYGIMNMAVEVTAQVLAKRALEESETRLKSAMEMAELATWSIDLVSEQVTYSSRLQEWLGVTDRRLSLAASPLVHERDRERITLALQAALAPDSSGVFDEVYTIIHIKTGQQKIIHSSGKAEFDAAGKPVSISGISQDVTMQQELRLALENEVQTRTAELAEVVEQLRATNDELEQANAQLQHSNDELAQYAYVASHDLQEPLRKIRVFTGMLKGGQNVSEGTQQTIDKISQSAARMSHLIQDLLEFSRLLKSDTLMRPVALQDAVMAVWDDFELMVAEKEAKLEVDLLPVIQGVNLQINQLFYNLISNALKFTTPERKPVITVTSRKISPEEAGRFIGRPLMFSAYHYINVSDNGIGFETQYNEQIFEVFKRLHGRDMYPGSGIGLALCRRIVANHHGYLYAESQVGRGSTFHIILPERQYETETDFSEDYSAFPAAD